jgi:hypothetical protein
MRSSKCETVNRGRPGRVRSTVNSGWPGRVLCTGRVAKRQEAAPCGLSCSFAHILRIDKPRSVVLGGSSTLLRNPHGAASCRVRDPAALTGRRGHPSTYSSARLLRDARLGYVSPKTAVMRLD